MSIFVCAINSYQNTKKDGEFCPATMSCIRTIPFSDVTEGGGGGT